MAYIKCSAEVHKLVKVRAAETGEEMQTVAEQAIRTYLTSHGPTSSKLGVDQLQTSPLHSDLQGKLSDRELEAWKEIHKIFGRPGGIFTLLSFAKTIIDAGGVHESAANTDLSRKKNRK